MKWQALVGCFVVGLLAVAPASAALIDFSTDPQLATDWTIMTFYDGNVSGGSTTASWNSERQDLDLASTYDELGAILLKNGATRADTDAVTLTLRDHDIHFSGYNWTSTGLDLFAVSSPSIFDDNPCYRFEMYTDAGSPAYILKGMNNALLGTYTLTTFPSTVKLDIERDGTDYVFKANDVEIFRDNSYASMSLPYYAIAWGASSYNVLTVRVDNFGVVPEPSTLVLLAAGLLGLLCYAWRKGK